MKALLSGQAGMALLIDGERIVSFGIDSPNLVSRSRSELPHLFADASDIVELANATIEDARAALLLAYTQDRALHMILILLDKNGDGEARQLSCELLEELLEGKAISRFLQNRLYSAPLPVAADIIGALRLAESLECRRLFGFVEVVGKLQKRIQHCRSDWDSIPAEMFGDCPERR